ncbi:hypothetical protein, partial [Caballeronia calidae]|uniref:hypothetical protein n=1 Tax=Caballeronia calidae TaxID=1777139 RepID=UPI001E619E67
KVDHLVQPGSEKVVSHRVSLARFLSHAAIILISGSSKREQDSPCPYVTREAAVLHGRLNEGRPAQ